MAYKNQNKNKKHIQELKNNPENWRFKEREKRKKLKKFYFEKLFNK